MIVVKVELWSAIDGRITELARMKIANDGHASINNHRRGSYDGATITGRDAETLRRNMNTGPFTRTGRVEDYPRLSLHVWNLVARMLAAMDYK